jgi:predicted nucleic acid-binding protein
VVIVESLARFCLDSDVLIDFLKKPSGEAHRIMKKGYEKEVKVCTTSVNAFEIWLGAHLANNPDIVQDTKGFLEKLEVLDFDQESSFEAGHILAELRKKGTPIEIRDLFVGCVCKVGGIPLITRNLRHYNRINGLEVMTPQQALTRI